MNDWHSWAAIAVFAGTYALIISEKIHRVAAALGGAGLMLAIGATDDVSAFYSEDSGVDWNVIFLLMGMMMIVGVLKKTGLFEYLAIWAVKRAKARPFRVMAMLIVITAVASALLDNVTTVLLIAPVTLLVCERLGLPAAPFLIAEVLASNIGGTATLVGDPPNIIIASRAGLTFNDFLVHLAPLSAVLIVVLLALCRFLFRRTFVYDENRAADIMELDEREAIRRPRLLVQGLAVLALVIVGFVLHPVLHYEPSIVALLGAGLLIAVSATETGDVLGEVEWPTLAFFAGLFIMIGGLIDTGVIKQVSSALADTIGDNAAGGSMVLLGASAVLSGIVDNIPYVATMAPITQDLVHQMGGAADHVMWWALALGADL
ncbi:putative transporter, partial [Streptomyces sp. NBRC 110611]|uniref:ArsB/NhaD family transporter n=1 Tax=Streptomyces sp. NBRC 110611 TaxID=1621259 RepID=UPI00082F4244